MVAGVFNRTGDDRGSRPLSYVSDEPGAHRHLSPYQLLAGPTLGQPAAEHVALGDPERAAFGAQRGEHSLKDPGKELVEVEGRTELQADGVQQPEALYLLAQLLGGGSWGIQDVGHDSGQGEMTPDSSRASGIPHTSAPDPKRTRHRSLNRCGERPTCCVALG